MSSYYPLACQCGEIHKVTARQAGQNVACACGRTVDVPTLRGLRELQPVAEGDTRGTAGSWSFGRGICFSLGLVVLLIGTGTAYYLHSLASRMSVPTHESVMEDLAIHIQQASPSDLWHLWTTLREVALASRPAPLRAEVEKVRDRLALAGNIAAGVAGLGGILLAAAYSRIGRLLASPGTSRT